MRNLCTATKGSPRSLQLEAMLLLVPNNEDPTQPKKKTKKFTSEAIWSWTFVSWEVLIIDLTSNFLFHHDSVLVGCTFLGIYPFLLGCPIVGV